MDKNYLEENGDIIDLLKNSILGVLIISIHNQYGYKTDSKIYVKKFSSIRTSMKSKLLFLFFSLCHVFMIGQTFLEIDNDTIHFKLDLTRGGAIAYISESNSERNIINIYDEGRYVQQSYYAGNVLNRQSEGQNPNWSPWSWNPIQVGDSYFNRAEILESNVTKNSAYTKCIPMLWDMNNKPAEATMEQWTTLKGSTLIVKNRLTCHRTDTIYGENLLRNQELPAVYPISSLDKLYTYNGTKPFTNDSIQELEVKHLTKTSFWGKYNDITENWMAFVNDDKWGLAVYTPITERFLAGMAGKPGGETQDASTSYIAPVKKIALNKTSVYEYTYYLLVGDLSEMRNNIYRINNSCNKQNLSITSK